MLNFYVDKFSSRTFHREKITQYNYTAKAHFDGAANERIYPVNNDNLLFIESEFEMIPKRCAKVSRP